jgi:trk system potassium uptake protein TrkH
VPRERLSFRFTHPAQFVATTFACAIVIGAGLLMLPNAKAGPGGADILTAFFTSTSAFCVTGLVVVDTPTYWSHFGQVVILLLVQLGGFGIMTLASMLALLVARRIGLRGRIIAQTERGVGLGDVRRIVKGVAAFTAIFEVTTATVISARLAASYGYDPGSAIYRGIFHAVSSFNNAGFALYSDNLAGFVSDGWISLAVCFAVITGGLGFPVWLELYREVGRPRMWTLHTKLTLLLTAVLLFIGFFAVLGFEWSNPATLGPLGVPGKLLASFFQDVQPRTAGFNTLNYGAMHDETLLVTTALMFVGAGSAGTAGGIKVTTLAVLVLMAWAEIRGEPELNAFGRRIPGTAQRQALTVTLIAFAGVALCTLVLIADTRFTVTQSLFESASAFGTVGLSTGITPHLPPVGKAALIVLMYLGRTGPHTLGTALALRERERRYRFAEERPIIG